MSHWVNDQIADSAIDTVANMSDSEVKQALFDSGFDTVFGTPVDMDAKRDILIDIVFDKMMSRPGPHG